jgi:hypothetical protein
VLSGERQPTFQMNMLPPCSGSKNKPSKKLAYSRLQAEPQDGGLKHLSFMVDYTSCPRI